MAQFSRREFVTGPLCWVGFAAVAPALVWGAGAMPSVAGRSRSRAFLDAVARGDLDVVRNLLAEDAGLLFSRDGNRRSAFAIAHLNRHPEIGDHLKQAGYRLDLHEAALATDWPRLAELARKTPGVLNQDHPIGGTAMYAAALGGAGSQIWRVYQYGGDPNTNPRGSESFTPVRVALEHPDFSVAELTAAALLANGADCNAPQKGGSSALHGACARGSVEIVEMLIRKGADLEAVDREGRSPLDVAEEKKHEQVISLLREHEKIPRDHSTSRLAYDVNGDPWAPDDLSAFSPVARNEIVGAAHFDFDFVKRTIARYPKLAKAIAESTESAVEACAHTGRKPIVEFLLEHGAPYSIATAVMLDDKKRVKELLIEDPLRIHERGPHDFALLSYPVIGGGLVGLMELLIDSGASVERQHNLGWTALHWAASGGQADMVSLLIEKGADVNRVGRRSGPERRTPLAVAMQGGHRKVIGLLKSRGAKRAPLAGGR